MAQGGSYIDVSSENNTRVAPCQKNLFKDIPEENELQSEDMERFKVYLRIKPTGASRVEDETIEVLDDKSVCTKTSVESTLRWKKINHEERCSYKFSNVFGPGSSQKVLFEIVAQNCVKELFLGKSCLLFTYGTTSSGKTYTVQGTQKNPGLIPRTLAVIFKTIRQNRQTELTMKPHDGMSVVRLTSEGVRSHDELKDLILNNDEFKGIKSSKLRSTADRECLTFNDLSEAAAFFKGMEKVLNKETERISLDQSSYFSIWVSFTEIYNENLYDLLQPISRTMRKPLHLGRDASSNLSFVKGLSYINVTNEEEAYKIFLYGRKSLQFASTVLNKHSSRSHCVFSIYLIKSSNLEDSNLCEVSRFTICDLAGAERQKKAHNIGDRLTESKNINTSLHVLNRCFSIIRDNQLKGTKLVVPFRESKITTLFQNALSGEESVTMIVNVNPESCLFDETQQVLRSSAIAKSIISRPLRKPNIKKVSRSRRFTQTFLKYVPGEEGSLSHQSELTETCDVTKKERENLALIETLMESNCSFRTENKKLKMQIKELEEKSLEMESDVRNEVVSACQKMYNEIREKHNIRLAEAEKRIRELCEENDKYQRLLEREEAKNKFNTKKRKMEPFDCSVSMIQSEPVVGEEIDPAFVTELEDQLKKYKTRIAEMMKEKKEVAEKAAELQCELNAEKNKFKELKKKNEENVKEFEASKLEVIKLMDELEIKETVLKEACEQIKTYESNEKEYTRHIQELQELVQLKDEKIEESENLVEQLKIEVENYAKEIEEIPLLKNDLEILKTQLKEKEDIIELQRMEHQQNPRILIEKASSTTSLEKGLEASNPSSPNKSSKSTLKNRESLSDSECFSHSVRRSKRITRKRLIGTQYSSDTEIGTPEDPKYPDFASPLSQFSLIAPLSSKKTKSRKKK